MFWITFTAAAISAPTTVMRFRRLLLFSATPAAVAALMSATAGATSAAAAPTSAAMSAAAALGKLRRYQYERRMSTICLVHSFVCLGRSYSLRGEDLF